MKTNPFPHSARQEWLDNLKAGDTVIVVGGGHAETFRRYAIRKVKRTTDTQIILGYQNSDKEEKFRRKGGDKFGDHDRWSGPDRLHEPTEEGIAFVRRRVVLDGLNTYLDAPGRKAIETQSTEVLEEMLKSFREWAELAKQQEVKTR